MEKKKKKPLILAITGATGVYAAELLMAKSPWPVSLVMSKWGREVYNRERGNADELAAKADRIFSDDDLSASVSSGSVDVAGMVILPCSINTMGKIASGMAESLITRAAHCQLKERRPLILCLRETPLTAIDLKNALTVSQAGGIVMPLSPPFYMFGKEDPKSITADQLLSVYVDRVLAVLGHTPQVTWEDVS